MNFQKLFAAISVGAHSLLDSLRPLANELKPLVHAAEEEIATFALNAVATEAPKVLSGQEKLSNATATVINGLAAIGKQVSASTAQAAVQTSYNFLSNLLNPPAAK